MALLTSSSTSSFILLLLIASSCLMPTSKAAAANLRDARLAWGGKSPAARQNIGWLSFLHPVLSLLHSLVHQELLV